MSTTFPFPQIRQHAWDRLPVGQVAKDQPSAVAGYEGLGAFDVELRPVYVDASAGEEDDYRLDPKHLAIRRVDTGDVFDVVSANYHLISPGLFAELLDVHVGRQVEAFAHLRGGRMQIAVYKLPDFEVLGDELDSHLIFINDMSGYRAIRAMIGTYRGLCVNGQVYIDANGTGKIFHDRNVEHNFREWLEYIPRQAEQRQADMQAVYEALARTSLVGVEAEVQKLLSTIYPLPAEPSRFGPQAEVEQREIKYERERKQIMTIRGETLALYEGAGTGMDHPACRGTAWGLLQAVMEQEEYRGGRLVAESNMVGGRQLMKTRAYSIICDAVGIVRDN